MPNQCDKQLLKKLEGVVGELLAENEKLDEKKKRSFSQILNEVLNFKDMYVPFEERRMYRSALGKIFGERGRQEAARRKEQDRLDMEITQRYK